MGSFISLIIAEIGIVTGAVLSGMTINKADTPESVKKYSGWNLAIQILVFIITLIIVIVLA